MHKQKSNLLFTKDNPDTTVDPRKSKFCVRKNIFRFAFKTLEILMMISQIAECVFEVFKK